MSLHEAFKSLHDLLQQRRSETPATFTFAKLKEQSDAWLASRATRFQPGDAVTASDVFVPTSFPKKSEVYIVLDIIADSPSTITDDEGKPYCGITNDVRILRMDKDGDVMPYVTHSAFLRHATAEDIERVESAAVSNICPNCGVDHSLEDGDDTSISGEFTPNQRFTDTPFDELAEEIASAIPEHMRTGDALHELAVFLNKSITDIPTYALKSHPNMVRMFLKKDFDRVYGMLTPESRETYNEIINEVRDELGAV